MSLRHLDLVLILGTKGQKVKIARLENVLSACVTYRA